MLTYFMSNSAFVFPTGDGENYIKLIREKMDAEKDTEVVLCGDSKNLELAEKVLWPIFGNRVKSQHSNFISYRGEWGDFKYELSLEGYPVVAFNSENEEFTSVEIGGNYPLEPDCIVYGADVENEGGNELDYWYDEVLFNHDETGKAECMDGFDF